MVISHLGIQLIKHFESFFDTAYLCPAQVWTIGWGTTVYPTGKEVAQGDKCTREEAEVFLAYDMTAFSKTIAELTKDIVLSQAQFDALVSLAYNIGANAFEGSTLLRLLRADVHNARIVGDGNLKWQVFGRDGQFLRWTLVNRRRNKGLIRRRKAEAWLFATGFSRFFEEMNTEVSIPLDDYVRTPRRI